MIEVNCIQFADKILGLEEITLWCVLKCLEESTKMKEGVSIKEICEAWTNVNVANKEIKDMINCCVVLQLYLAGEAELSEFRNMMKKWDSIGKPLSSDDIMIQVF